MSIWKMIFLVPPNYFLLFGCIIYDGFIIIWWTKKSIFEIKELKNNKFRAYLGLVASLGFCFSNIIFKTYINLFNTCI